MKKLLIHVEWIEKKKKGYRDVLAVAGIAWIRIRYAGDE